MSVEVGQPAWLREVLEVASVCKRGLVSYGVLDITKPDLHSLLVVQLACAVDVDEDMRQLYSLLDVMYDAGFLSCPRRVRSRRRRCSSGSRSC